MADTSQKENFIQLKKDNILRIGIKDSDGNEIKDKNGKNICLEFDMEDIELPLKLNECEARHRKNLQYLKTQGTIIEKQEDKKGKYLLSWKQEEQIKLIRDFYNREIEALDLFLGKGGTKKILNGRNPYLSMYDDIAEIIEPIMPLLKQHSEDIYSKIKNKYSKNKEKGVLE